VATGIINTQIYSGTTRTLGIIISSSRSSLVHSFTIRIIITIIISIFIIIIIIIIIYFRFLSSCTLSRQLSLLFFYSVFRITISPSSSPQRPRSSSPFSTGDTEILSYNSSPHRVTSRQFASSPSPPRHEISPRLVPAGNA